MAHLAAILAARPLALPAVAAADAHRLLQASDLIYHAARAAAVAVVAICALPSLMPAELAQEELGRSANRTVAGALAGSEVM